MRNIIICCDGTGNEISENISNVLKLYRCLRKTEKTTPRQLVYYDPGVGTLARPDPWHRLKQDFNAILGLATGYGLDDNVLAAYEFLVHTWQPGDQIYLFGFSRGAYTVRVLAGLIHKIGLITPEQVNLAGSGLIAYKQFSSDEAPKLRAKLKALTDAAAAEDTLPPSPFDNAAQFARITSSRWPTIRFVGVWDTVASVIVPRADRFYWPSLEELALTLQNPSVQTFRQAISIDERRSMFRLKKWDDPQTYKPVRFNEVNASAAGYPAGVVRRRARRYRRRLSGEGKRAFEISAALDDRRGGRNAGSGSITANVNQLAWGVQRKSSPFSYVAPDVRGRPAHFAARRVVDPRIFAEEREVQGMAGAKDAFRLLHPGRRAALHSGWRHDPRIRDQAHGGDAELSAGEHAGEVRDVPDAGAAGGTVRVRRRGRIVGWAKRSVPTIPLRSRCRWWARCALPTLQTSAEER